MDSPAGSGELKKEIQMVAEGSVLCAAAPPRGSAADVAPDGFAQNYAGRRIPFENAAYSAYWNRAAGESLHIPTFATGAAGPYLPGTAIKGALRTGMVFAHWRDGMLQDALARVKSERVPRRPAEIVEEQALGLTGSNRMRFVSAGDSAPIAVSRFQIYLLRTSTLQPRGGSYALGWKQTPRGAADGAPVFPPRVPGWMPPTRTTARSSSNSGSTTARSLRICPSPRPAALFS